MKFDEIRNSAGPLFDYWREQAGAEIYVDLATADARPAATLLIDGGCRLVAVFAEDRTAPEARYNVYYVFEHSEDRRYLLLRAPVPSNDPVFPSLAAEIPAVNWQE